MKKNADSGPAVARPCIAWQRKQNTQTGQAQKLQELVHMPRAYHRLSPTFLNDCKKARTVETDFCAPFDSNMMSQVVLLSCKARSSQQALNV